MRLWVARCCALLAISACGGVTPPSRPGGSQAPSFIQLVETVPSSTQLGHADIADTHLIWTEMIDGARTQIELSHFYASFAPTSSSPARLRPIIDALARAKKRGVRIRMILDATFADKYPDAISELKSVTELRLYNVRQSMGGVQHAKYFLVDRREFYLGSANFDWRALEHIHEIGVRIQQRGVVAALSDVFEMDWALAGGRPKPPSPAPAHFPVEVGPKAQLVTPLFSPKGWLPNEQDWDLPALIAMIDGAKKRVALQLLSFKTAFRDGRSFRDIEQALVRAAKRGVKVDIILSHWVTGPGSKQKIGAISKTQGIHLKIATVPPHPDGFIPFARVVHAKYMVVDDHIAWVGTSNFSGDYFHQSRNVGVMIEGAHIARQLTKIFRQIWTSSYAHRYEVSQHASVKPRVAK